MWTTSWSGSIAGTKRNQPECWGKSRKLRGHIVCLLTVCSSPIGFPGERLLLACAVQRRRFPVGESPTRRNAPAGSNRSSYGGNETVSYTHLTLPTKRIV